MESNETTNGFLVDVPVRWSDMDAFQHINHARMITLLEEARIPWLFYEDKPTSNLKNGCVIVDLKCTYKKQLRHIDGPLQILMGITKLRNIDFNIYYEVRAHGVNLTDSPAVIAETHIASFDINNQSLRRLTKPEKDYLAEFLI